MNCPNCSTALTKDPGIYETDIPTREEGVKFPTNVKVTMVDVYICSSCKTRVEVTDTKTYTLPE